MAADPFCITTRPKANLKTLNLNASLAIRERWTFTGGYFFSNGTSNSALYGIYDPNGNQLSAKPNTTGFELEVDRTLTQNIIASAQYTGFTKFNALTTDIDGMGRAASDNNTLWLSVFFAF